MEATKSFQASYAALGMELFEAQRYQDALDALKKALAEPPTGESRHEIYLTMGRTYSALNKDSDALAALSEAVRLNPDVFPEVEREISKLRSRVSAEDSPGAKKGVSGWLRRIWGDVSSRIARQLKAEGTKLLASDKFADAENLLSLASASLPKDADIHECLGWARLKQGKLVESLDSFSRAIELDDKRAYSHQGLGNAYLELGQNEKAAASLKRALELKPGEPRVLLLQGTVLRNLKQYDESEKILQSIIKLDPENDVALRELAETLRAAGRNPEAALILCNAARLVSLKKQYADAERLSQEAIDLDPSKAGGYLELGKARIGLGQYAKALEVLNRAVEIEQSVAAQLALAQAHFLQENLEKASECIDQALTLSPESPEALGFKGAIFQRWGRNDEALEKLDKSLELNPQQAHFCVERGHALESLGRPLEAVAAYEQAIKLDHLDRWAYGRMGVILYDSYDSEDKYNDSASALKQALELPPKEEENFYVVAQPLHVYSTAELHMTRGQALRMANKYEEAISEFDVVIGLDATNADACALRGSSLFYLSRYQDAVEAFQLSLDLYAAQADEVPFYIYAELGEALRAIGKYRESRTAFKKAISVQDDDPWVLARYGETLRMLEKLDESESTLRTALKLAPDDAWTLGALGATCESLRKYRSALEMFDKALKLEPEDAFNLGYTGKILREVERYPAAVEAFTKSLKIEQNMSWVWIENGMTLRDMPDGNVEEALVHLKRGRELAPDDADSLYELAICQYKLSKYAEALESVNQTYKLAPTFTSALCLKSLILNKLGTAELAQQTHDEALGDSTTAEAYYTRGSIYSDLFTTNGAADAYTPAVRDLEEAMQKKPDYKEAYNDLAWLYIVSQEPRLDEASTLIERAIALEPSVATYLDTLGWIYFKKGMLNKAFDELQKATELDPEDLVIADHFEVCRERITAEQGTAGASSTA